MHVYKYIQILIPTVELALLLVLLAAQVESKHLSRPTTIVYAKTLSCMFFIFLK